MNNNEYLDNVISLYNGLDKLTTLQPIAIYDLDLKVVFSSRAYQEARGKEGHVGGNGLPPEKDFYKQKHSTEEAHDVIRTRMPSYSMNFNYLQTKLQPYITKKTPIINAHTDCVVGVEVILQRINYTSIKFSLLNGLNLYKFSKRRDLSQYKLTKRESQVIFLFLQGLTSKEIALVISKLENKSVTKNAIDAVFNGQLKVKFNVFSRDELYQHLIKLGFYRVIPSSLMFSTKLDIDEVIVL